MLLVVFWRPLVDNSCLRLSVMKTPTPTPPPLWNVVSFLSFNLHLILIRDQMFESF